VGHAERQCCMLGYCFVLVVLLVWHQAGLVAHIHVHFGSTFLSSLLRKSQIEYELVEFEVGHFQLKLVNG